MVKNAAGGNKSKRFARKHAQESSAILEPKNVRSVKEEGEMYAAVSKICGSNNCIVVCSDGVSRLCMIRRKFSKGQKGDNKLYPGSWVLVGIRDWEVLDAGKTQKCDLLEIFTHQEQEVLKKNSKIDLRALNGVGEGVAIKKSGSLMDDFESYSDNENNGVEEGKENMICTKTKGGDISWMNIEDI
jgi:initiation factor 1A